MKLCTLRHQPKRASWIIAALLVFVGGLSMSPPASAQDYRLDMKTEAVPTRLSPAVRAVLSPNALVISGSHGRMCEIWVRDSLPVVESASQQLGVTFGRIQPGTLVGAVRFYVAMNDYRNQTVKPGIYTLRYNLNPVDGNHQGVAPQRDFLLAIPTADDPNPGKLTSDKTIALSRKSTTTNHPSVWSVGPVDPAAVKLPALENHQEDDSWNVDFEIPTAEKTAVRMSLVVVGHSADI